MSKQSNQRYRKELEKRNTAHSESMNSTGKDGCQNSSNTATSSTSKNGSNTLVNQSKNQSQRTEKRNPMLLHTAQDFFFINKQKAPIPLENFDALGPYGPFEHRYSSDTRYMLSSHMWLLAFLYI